MNYKVLVQLCAEPNVKGVKLSLKKTTLKL